MYIITELLWRGSSHWSMFFLGGACFLIIGLINEQNRGRLLLILQMGISAVIITVMEFCVGYVINLKLKMGVWDYSDMKYNVMGQVCLLYTILWFFLSLPCIIADDWLRYALFGEKKQKYRIFRRKI